jgi:three-Cys-motif partner protein
MKQEFGGIWTRKKIAVLNEYLRSYSTALKSQNFILHYVDAFAGNGTNHVATTAAQDLLIPLEDFRGSVRTALEVKPGFHKFHFNDLNPECVAELERLQREFPDKDIKVYTKDANRFVCEFCDKLRWNDRVVIFLDPFSTQLDWTTLHHISKVKQVDLWFLFPISVILRMTPRYGTKIRPEWSDTLARLLGTDEWEFSLYKQTPTTADLFESTDEFMHRINTSELGNWVTERLREIFPYVAPPVQLNNNNRPLFLLFLAVSNPNEKAWSLAQRIATSIIHKYRD